MTVIWAVLGALLITAVFAVLVVFFFVRPALAKKINVAAKALSSELYGRPPLISSAASCEGSTDPGRSALTGIGVIALTEQALVFVAGGNKASVIIPVANLVAVTTSTTFTSATRLVRRPRSMLVVKWRVPGSFDQGEPAIAFTLDQAQLWVDAIPTPDACPDRPQADDVSTRSDETA